MFLDNLAQSGYTQFVLNYKAEFVTAHVAAAVAGIGFALLADFLFFKYLRDGVIETAEARSMNAVSKFIWLVILILLFTGGSLYLLKTQTYDDTPRFLLKMFVTLVIIFNGIELNIGIGPQLPTIFGITAKGRTWRRLAFIHGAISMTSWSSAFFLGVYKKFDWDIATYFSVYLGVLLFAIVTSLILEQVYYRRNKNG